MLFRSKKSKSKKRDTQGALDEGDRALVCSRGGKIFVGISGLDVFEEPKKPAGLS